jgi:hypothetical protein
MVKIRQDFERLGLCMTAKQWFYAAGQRDFAIFGLHRSYLFNSMLPKWVFDAYDRGFINGRKWK